MMKLASSFQQVPFSDSINNSRWNWLNLWMQSQWGARGASTSGYTTSFYRRDLSIEAAWQSVRGPGHQSLQMLRDDCIEISLITSPPGPFHLMMGRQDDPYSWHPLPCYSSWVELLNTLWTSSLPVTVLSCLLEPLNNSTSRSSTFFFVHNKHLYREFQHNTQ